MSEVSFIFKNIICKKYPGFVLGLVRLKIFLRHPCVRDASAISRARPCSSRSVYVARVARLRRLQPTVSIRWSPTLYSLPISIGRSVDLNRRSSRRPSSGHGYASCFLVGEGLRPRESSSADPRVDLGPSVKVRLLFIIWSTERRCAPYEISHAKRKQIHTGHAPGRDVRIITDVTFFNSFHTFFEHHFFGLNVLRNSLKKPVARSTKRCKKAYIRIAACCSASALFFSISSRPTTAKTHLRQIFVAQ